jgi:hypothetical protein
LFIQALKKATHFSPILLSYTKKVSFAPSQNIPLNFCPDFCGLGFSLQAIDFYSLS